MHPASICAWDWPDAGRVELFSVLDSHLSGGALLKIGTRRPDHDGACVSRMIRIAALFVFFPFSLLSFAAGQPGSLRIYFIDVEGGQATLFVSPAGQSLLIDAGWPDSNARDAARIVGAAKTAGIAQIDYLLVTHYHDDHVGGVPQLAERMKIVTFVDHGPNREDSDDTRKNYAAYKQVVKNAKHLVVKPGDRIPIEGMDVEVVSADGSVIHTALPAGGEPNAVCNSEPAPAEDPTENARSLGVLITYGKLRILDLGDLTKKGELALVCPVNLLGPVDLFVVSHHGWSQSNSKAFVDAIRPRVAIMDNGAKKGGSPDVWTVLRGTPGLVDLWQLHYSIEGGREHNVAADYIANSDEKCQGIRIDVTANADGEITVTNQRNGFNKTYGK